MYTIISKKRKNYNKIFLLTVKKIKFMSSVLVIYGNPLFLRTSYPHFYFIFIKCPNFYLFFELSIYFLYSIVI